MFEVFLKDISKESIITHCHPTTIFRVAHNYEITNPQEFSDKNFEIFKDRILKVKEDKTSYFFHKDDYFAIPRDIINEFDQYRDNCNRWDDMQYPIMDIVVNNGTYQDHFEFIKTKEGFKLLGFTLINEGFW